MDKLLVLALKMLLKLPPEQESERLMLSLMTNHPPLPDLPASHRWQTGKLIYPLEKEP
jgi:hypothetical protein